MMHAKWHCTPFVNNRVMVLCILKKCFFWRCLSVLPSRTLLCQEAYFAGDINSTNLLVSFNVTNSK